MIATARTHGAECPCNRCKPCPCTICVEWERAFYAHREAIRHRRPREETRLALATWSALLDIEHPGKLPPIERTN